MIFCFSGTGNSRYIAQRIAEALQKTVIDLNARIKETIRQQWIPAVMSSW